MCIRDSDEGEATLMLDDAVVVLGKSQLVERVVERALGRDQKSADMEIDAVARGLCRVHRPRSTRNLAEHRLDGGQRVGYAKGLLQKGGVNRHPLAHDRFADRAHDDDRSVVVLRLLAHGVDHARAVEIGHHVIDQHQIGLDLAQTLEPLAAVDVYKRQTVR